MLQNYISLKEEIRTYANNLHGVSVKYDIKTVADNLKLLQERLDDDEFQLVVVGMFSRGKSTFVDALLGKRLLPTSKKPTTAIISKITYQKEAKFILNYKDSVESQVLTEDEFFSLTASNTEGDDIWERKIERISFAEVCYPLEFCQNGVSLVDTPGTNDLNQARVEITYQYLNKADAVVMLLAADQALSIGEVEFLKERVLKNQILDIFFIINRKDTLNGPQEEQRVLEFVKQNLITVLGESFQGRLHLHLVSSYQALLWRRKQNGEYLSVKQELKIPSDFSCTGFVDLESDLAHFLEHEKGRIKIQRFNDVLLRDSSQLCTFIANKSHIISHSTDDIENKIMSLQNSCESTKQLVDIIIEDIKNEFSQLQVLVTDKCKIILGTVPNKFKDALNSYDDEYNVENINSFVKNQLEIAQKNIIEEVSNYQKVLIHNGCERGKEKIEKLFSLLNKKYNESFDITMNRDVLSLVEYQNIAENTSSEESVSQSIFNALRSYYSNSQNNILLRGFAKVIARFAKESAKDDIMRLFEKEYPNWAKVVETHIINQYMSYSTMIINQLTSIVHSQLDVLNQQLLSVKREKLLKESEKLAMLADLEADIMLIKDIQQKIQNMI